MSICEECVNFIYDEDLDEEVCMINLDEDEYYRFLQSNEKECPFFSCYDEYGIVRKQN